MPISLLTAIVTATLFAIPGFPFRHYQCWFSFNKPGTTLGTIIYLIFAGGGGGLLGWGAAELSHAQPTTNPLASGALLGIGGALVLRADFTAGPKSDIVRHHLGDARSALTATIKWTATLLDDVSSRRINAWLSAMPDDELCDEALRIKAHIDDQPPEIVPDRAKKAMYARLVPAMEQLDDPDHRSAGRAHLITFCSRYYIERHLPKPLTVTPARIG
jgi:hypothetical protein